MNITLIDYTGKGSADPARAAANVLVFTKNTRLSMNQDFLAEVEGWSNVKILQELEYMANTIPSSWEFVHYSFLIDGVTRAFTAQLCRTRTASFAEKTLRIVDVSDGPGWTYGRGPSLAEINDDAYDGTMKEIARAYKALIAKGVAVEDARGILPLNIKTRICMSLNLRNFVDMVRKRSSPRVQGEYRAVLEAMKAAVMAVHPWAALFLDRTFERAAQDLDAEIASMPDKAQATRMLKLVDILRAQS